MTRSYCFLQLNHALVNVKNNQIDSNIRQLVTKVRASRDAKNAHRALTAKGKSPEECLGPVQVMKFMRFFQVQHVHQLPNF